MLQKVFDLPSSARTEDVLTIPKEHQLISFEGNIPQHLIPLIPNHITSVRVKGALVSYDVIRSLPRHIYEIEFDDPTLNPQINRVIPSHITCLYLHSPNNIRYQPEFLAGLPPHIRYLGIDYNIISEDVEQLPLTLQEIYFHNDVPPLVMLSLPKSIIIVNVHACHVTQIALACLPEHVKGIRFHHGACDAVAIKMLSSNVTDVCFDLPFENKTLLALPETVQRVWINDLDACLKIRRELPFIVSVLFNYTNFWHEICRTHGISLTLTKQQQSRPYAPIRSNLPLYFTNNVWQKIASYATPATILSLNRVNKVLQAVIKNHSNNFYKQLSHLHNILGMHFVFDKDSIYFARMNYVVTPKQNMSFLTLVYLIRPLFFSYILSPHGYKDLLDQHRAGLHEYIARDHILWSFFEVLLLYLSKLLSENFFTENANLQVRLAELVNQGFLNFDYLLDESVRLTRLYPIYDHGTIKLFSIANSNHWRLSAFHNYQALHIISRILWLSPDYFVDNIYLDVMNETRALRLLSLEKEFEELCSIVEKKHSLPEFKHAVHVLMMLQKTTQIKRRVFLRIYHVGVLRVEEQHLKTLFSDQLMSDDCAKRLLNLTDEQFKAIHPLIVRMLSYSKKFCPIKNSLLDFFIKLVVSKQTDLCKYFTKSWLTSKGELSFLRFSLTLSCSSSDIIAFLFNKIEVKKIGTLLSEGVRLSPRTTLPQLMTLIRDKGLLTPTVTTLVKRYCVNNIFQYEDFSDCEFTHQFVDKLKRLVGNPDIPTYFIEGHQPIYSLMLPECRVYHVKKIGKHRLRSNYVLVDSSWHLVANEKNQMLVLGSLRNSLQTLSRTLELSCSISNTFICHGRLFSFLSLRDYIRIANHENILPNLSEVSIETHPSYQDLSSYLEPLLPSWLNPNSLEEEQPVLTIPDQVATSTALKRESVNSIDSLKRKLVMSSCNESEQPTAKRSHETIDISTQEMQVEAVHTPMIFKTERIEENPAPSVNFRIAHINEKIIIKLDEEALEPEVVFNGPPIENLRFDLTCDEIVASIDKIIFPANKLPARYDLRSPDDIKKLVRDDNLKSYRIDNKFPTPPLEVRCVHLIGNAKGVFATQAITNLVQPLGRYLGDSVVEPTSAYIFTFTKKKKSIDALKNRNWTAYINHSIHPNIRIVECDDDIEFYPLRPIKAGEQLTIDYGQAYFTALRLVPLYLHKSHTDQSDDAIVRQHRQAYHHNIIIYTHPELREFFTGKNHETTPFLIVPTLFFYILNNDIHAVSAWIKKHPIDLCAYAVAPSASGFQILPPNEQEQITGLMLAAFCGHIEMVKLLLKEGADLNRRMLHKGLSALTIIMNSQYPKKEFADFIINDHPSCLETIIPLLKYKTEIINFILQTPLRRQTIANLDALFTPKVMQDNDDLKRYLYASINRIFNKIFREAPLKIARVVWRKLIDKTDPDNRINTDTAKFIQLEKIYGEKLQADVANRFLSAESKDDECETIDNISDSAKTPTP